MSGASYTATGVLGLDFASDTPGQYGAVAISAIATLGGALRIDLTGGFTLATGDSFDILGFGSLAGNFASLALDGAGCWAAGADSWSCGGGVFLNEEIAATSLDLVVAGGPPVFGLRAGASSIPEPSTWAMLALGLPGPRRPRPAQARVPPRYTFLDSVSTDVRQEPTARNPG